MEKLINLEGSDKVIQYKNKVVKKPLVSVSVVTYKHEKYIKQCLDGILVQKTTFDFEILLGEDDSADDTRNICIGYANRYPDKIRLFLHDRSNVIYINGNPTGRFNFIYNLSQAKGKYVALCEGDDYWTDSLKLQKQVDFLEANKDYGLVHTDCDQLHEINNKFDKNIHSKYNIFIPQGNIFEDLLIRNIIKTQTVLFRKDMLPEKFYNFRAGDYPLWLEISQISKIGYLNDSTSVYRKRINSMSNFSDIKKEYNFQKGIYEIKIYFINKYGCRKDTKKIVDANYNKRNFEYAYKLKDYELAFKYYSSLDNHLKNSFKYKLKLLASRNNLIWHFSKQYFRIVNKLIPIV